jgi:hypothetical protein
MIDQVISYAARGWAVFPLVPREKIPPKGSKGFLDATKDEPTLRALWGAQPLYNIGIATGERSGIWVLDIDPRHGGSESLRALQEKNGKLPTTVSVATGGGGWQLYYKHVPGLRNSARRADGMKGVAPGIDVRGDGGYVVAPPSVHPSGKTYAFMTDRTPDDMTPADAPAWLVALALHGPAAADAGLNGGSVPGRKKPESYYRELFKRGAGAGERNDALVTITGYLLRKRVDPLIVHDMMQLWNKARFDPPAPEGDVEKKVDLIGRAEIERETRKSR